MDKSLEERIKRILEQCTPEESQKLQSKVESRKFSDEPFVKEYKNILKKRRLSACRSESDYHKGEEIPESDERTAQAMLWQNSMSDEDVDCKLLNEATDYIKLLIFKMKSSISGSAEMELYIINSVLDLFQKKGYSEQMLEQIEQITIEELDRMKKSREK